MNKQAAMLYELQCIALGNSAFNCVQIKKPQRNANIWPNICYIFNLTTCKGDINISKQIQKSKFRNTRAPPTLSPFSIMLEKMLSPLPPHRCESQEGTTVWCPSLAPLCLASSPGRGGTEVIKNTASPSVWAWCVSGLLSLWRCRLSGFPPYEVTGDKTKIRYQHVCQLSTIPSVFPDKTRLASWLQNFHKAWTILTDATKKGNVIKFEPVSLKIKCGECLA